ncbi:hypothetical protein ACFQDN_20140 [Pseudomonas asuensis]
MSRSIFTKGCGDSLEQIKTELIMGLFNPSDPLIQIHVAHGNFLPFRL